MTQPDSVVRLIRSDALTDTAPYAYAAGQPLTGLGAAGQPRGPFITRTIDRAPSAA
jgi:hypothetical protein